MVWRITPILMNLLVDWYDELEDELKDGDVFIDHVSHFLNITKINLLIKI